MIRVAIVSAAEDERENLSAIVRGRNGLALTASTASFAQLQLSDATNVDVLVVDDVPGSLAGARLAHASGVAIVVITEETQTLSAVVDLRDSIAFLPTFAREDEVIAAIEAAHTGLFVSHPDLLRDDAAILRDDVLALRDDVDGPPDFAATSQQLLEPLTPRELQVLHLLAAGLGNKAIALRLQISEHTAKFHVGQILSKLDAGTRAEAVSIAMRRGFVSL